MRRVLWVVAVAGMAAGCGGGTEPVNPSPPPPPPAGPPASVAVEAGDNQTGEPGVKLPTKASVIVRDAGGRAVANVPVVFAVDSGGGTLAGGQAASGADGVATAGDWVLGPAEGTNVLLVTAAGLPPVRVRASGTYAGVTVTAGTLAASGGKLTLDRPGSVLDRLEIEAGASVFATPVSFSVTTNSSAGLSLPTGVSGGSRRSSQARAITATTALPGLIPVTPIITFVSNGPHTAAGEVLLRIPLPKGVGFDVVVAVVDTAGNPIAYLPAIAIDTISVTVATRGLDQDIYAQIIPSSTPKTRKLSVVVFAPGIGQPQVPLNQWLPFVVNASFAFGKNNFEFSDVATGLTPQIDAGMALAEFGGLWVYPGGLHNVMQRAAGVHLSNTRGIMLSAGLSESYHRQLGAYGAQWIKSYETAYTPAVYQRLVLGCVYWHLKDYMTPAKLLLTDGINTRMVLALGWSSITGALTIRDPAYSGVGTLRFVNGIMQPYAHPGNPGIVYTTPYFSNSLNYAMWPETYQGLVDINSASALEPYFSSWPGYSYRSWDFLLHAFPDRSVPDTLFMVGDSTRIWPMTQQTSFPISSTLPTGGQNLQNGSFYQRRASGWGPIGNGSSHLIDARPGANPNAWFTQTLGMAVSRLESADGTSLAWMAWRQIDVVKYALKVADAADKPGVPVRFSITSPGGPTLPTSAQYEWNFHDQSPLVKVTGPGPVIHTFAQKGTYAVEVKVFHGTQTAGLIAKTQATATIADSAIFHIPQDTVEVILGSPITLTVKNKNAPTPKPIRYEWSLDHVVGAFIVPTTVKVEGDSVLQHTWNEVGTFAARVTVRDSVTNKILGQDTVQVNIGLNAWKFTAVSVQFHTVETVPGYGLPSAVTHRVCYPCWVSDSLLLVRLRDGVNEAGLLHLDKTYTFPWPAPLIAFDANPGLYLLEGTNITEARLSTVLDFHVRDVSASAPPAAGRIKTHWMVYDNWQMFRNGPTVDGNYLVDYSEVGTLTSGSIVGTAWGPSLPLHNNTVYFPVNVRQADVTFNGNTATGTLTFIFRTLTGNVGCVGQCREAWRTVGTLSFTAQRVQ